MEKTSEIRQYASRGRVKVSCIFLLAFMLSCEYYYMKNEAVEIEKSKSLRYFSEVKIQLTEHVPNQKCKRNKMLDIVDCSVLNSHNS